MLLVRRQTTISNQRSGIIKNIATADKKEKRKEQKEYADHKLFRILHNNALLINNIKSYKTCQVLKDLYLL